MLPQGAIMKSLLLLFSCFLSLSAFSLEVCNTDCELSKIANQAYGVDNANSSRLHTRFLNSNDEIENVYGNLIDFKNCTAKVENQVQGPEVDSTITIKIFKTSGTEAQKYLYSWKALNSVSISPELDKKLQKEFKSDRTFCIGSYFSSDEWTSEYSNFVVSEDGDFFFSEFSADGI